MADTTNTTNFTIEDVVKKWSDLGGKIDQYLVQEFDAFENNVKKHCVALVDKASASIAAQVNNVTLQEGLNVLFNKAGDIRIDPAIGVPATKDQAVAVHPESQVTPAVTGPGYGVADTTTTAASGIADLNNQPTVPDTSVSAQAQLANKPVDVTDVTPVDGQSQDAAAKAAVGDGTATTNGGVPVADQK